MKKLLRLRTKVEVVFVACLLIILSSVGVWSVTRTISPTRDTIKTFIETTNGTIYSATASGLQDAIWNLNGTGGTVWIPATEITGIDNITINNDAISIIGSSWRSRYYENDVRLTASGSCTTTMFYSEYNETHFENILFYGDDMDNGNDMDAITIEGDISHIVGCAFNQISGTAINITTGTSHQIERCRGMNINDSFIILRGTDSDISFCDATSTDSIYFVDASPNRIVSCNAYLSTFGDGFQSDSSGDGLVIDSCRANDNTRDGIRVYASTGCILMNNRIDDNSEKGIHVVGCTNSIISNNYVVESDEAGIYLTDTSSDCVVIGNSLHNNGEDTGIVDLQETGILVVAGDNITIVGNKCEGAKYGITEDYYLKSSKNIILGNNLENNDNAGYYTDGATESIIINNRGYDNSTYQYIPFGASSPYSSPSDGAMYFVTGNQSLAVYWSGSWHYYEQN